MKDLFIKIKNLSVITIVVSLLIGVVLLVRPEESLKLVSLLSGVTVIALGISALVSYFAKYKSIVLATLGTLTIIAGIVICVKYKAIVSAIVFIFGLFILFSGVVDFFASIASKRNLLSGWIVSLVLALVSIIIGIVIVVNPFGSVVALTRILGVGLIVYAVMDIVVFVQTKRIERLINSKQIDSDADEVE